LTGPIQEQEEGVGMQEPIEERQIPWWAWLFVALSILLFVGFFLTFAVGVTRGGVDGYCAPAKFICYCAVPGTLT
jgi:hypothetical protein